MPELPEVEAARRLIERKCVGKRVAKATCADDDKVVQGCSPRDVEKAFQGRVITAAHRRAKYFFLETDGGNHALFHLGMVRGDAAALLFAPTPLRRSFYCRRRHGCEQQLPLYMCERADLPLT